MRNFKPVLMLLLVILPIFILILLNCPVNSAQDNINPPPPTPAVTAGTPTPAPSVGTVWISPADQTVANSTKFTTQLFLNSGTQKLGAYNFIITYDAADLSVDTSVGTNGVVVGPDGFVTVVNSDAKKITIAGFDTSGKGPGSNMNLLTINWIAGMTSGITFLDLSVDNLTDESTYIIGTPAGISGHVGIE